MSEMQLMSLCVNNPNEDKEIRKFNKGAVRLLIKELKGKSSLLNGLERAIREKCPDSKCVTISAKSEWRLLVAHRRSKPQVVYCRLWRWPDLQSHHQIKSICPTDQDSESSDAICINPYHYTRNIPKPIDPILVPYSKIPPDLSSSFEESEPRTKSWPANVSFIGRLEPFLNQPQTQAQQQQQQQQLQPLQQQQLQRRISHPGQAMTHSEMQTSDSTPSEGRAQNSIPREVEAPDSISREVEAIDTPGTIPSAVEQRHALSQHMQPQPQPQPPLTQQQPQQIQQLQPQQYQQPQYQSLTQPQQQPQQYLQPQAELNATPCQLQARDPFGRSQGRQFLKQQPSQMSLLHQSQYRANMSQGGVGPLASQQKTFVTKTETGRPFHFRPKGFTGRVDQEQINTARDPRFNGTYPGNPYPCSSRVAAQMPYPPSGPVQRAGMVVSPMSDSNPSSQLICSPSNSTYSPSSLAPDQQNVTRAQVPNTDYPAMFSSQQQQPPQYQAQEQPAHPSYPEDTAMTIEQQQDYEVYPTAAVNDDQNYSYEQQTENTLVIDMQEVPFIDDKYWCSITYHEYDARIGEKYHSTSPIVSVDGFTQPMCNDRFCIGGISHVNRNQFTEWVRRRIGRGVKFTYVNGDVYVEGLSESSIFVSSPLHDTEHQTEMCEDLVVKLSSGQSARVFSTHEFGRLLHSAVAQGFESVYRLTSRCVVRVSFVKGWGKNYKRHSIYNTPCWVEVQLNGPLQWIDKVLRQMRPPMGCCSTS